METNVKLRQAFGQVLSELRENKAVSQQDLAGECDIERAYISRIERGLVQPSLSVIFKISEGLGLPPAVLIEKVFQAYKATGKKSVKRKPHSKSLRNTQK